MRILLIEDDEKLCESLVFYLNGEGYATDTCHDGLDTLSFIKQCDYDLIILDRMLPSLDGLNVLRQIRSKEITTPVLMLTALSDIDNKVEGLDAGADDYLGKPFATQELLARIRALGRRPAQLKNIKQLTVSDVTLDLNTFILTGPSHNCSLSKREAALLEIFLNNMNTLLPRHTILSRVWGPYSPVEDGNLDNYIHFLRRRLKTVGSTLKISTTRGVGYTLEVSHA
ncbi:response regulator transcription factor [Cellulosilyticum ruminicola]|uniref:response regulator transcription factor n=1 Tax=Cellulosilyticum ruminicola TaxID=425254 RepID=UPI0006D0D42C|nr:response regulator transcription factor [Cellulosilyticum ruminicola]